MSAGAPWSVKGIDPKAREIAKDLARRSGMTLGEWLNQMILEDGPEEESVVPFARRQPAYAGLDRRGRSRRLDDEAARVADLLEAMSERIEAAERRSTLAISGVDQAVAGVLARLEAQQAEQLQQADRLASVLEDVRDGHDRLRRLERETPGSRPMEAVKALETALGKIANQVYEGETRTRAALGEMQEELSGAARRVGRLEAEAPVDGSALVEGVVARIAERLERAEAETSAAVRALETSFAHLDQRLNAAETRVEPEREARFERLAEELSRRVEQSRAEMVRHIETVSQGRFDRVERALSDLNGHVQAAEKRSANAVERMGQEVLRIAQNLNRRMTGVEDQAAEAVERVGMEVARVAETVEQRLGRNDSEQGLALERLAGEIARISERLSERIVQSERRAATTAGEVGERVDRLADKLEARHERTSSELSERIRLSEERTQRLLEEAREKIDRQLQGRRAETAPAPVAEPEFAPFAAARFDVQDEAETLFEEASEDEFAAFVEAAEARAPAVEPEDVGAFDDPFAAETEFAAEPAFAPEAEAEPFPEPFAFDDEEAARPRPPVSTREAIEAARAAARLGVKNSTEGSGLGFASLKLNSKARFEERVEKQKKREASTVKKALLASATAATIASAVTGYVYIFNDEGTSSLPADLQVDAAADAGADTALPPTAIAAVATAPTVTAAPEAVAPDAGAIYDEAVRMLAAEEAGAVQTLTRAANLGWAPAQFHLGKLYEGGEHGLKQDAAEARRWTERAATGGERRAMHNLGLYHFDGVGGPKNLGLAAQWFRKAAELGLVDSQYNLGRLYEQGFGVGKDPAEAYKWYLIASRAGDSEARKGADQLRADLSIDQRLAAERAASAFRVADPEPSALAER